MKLKKLALLWLSVLCGTQSIHILSAQAGSRCEKHLSDFSDPIYVNIDRSLGILNSKDLMVLETLIYMHLGHNTIGEFKRRGFMDFQFYAIPNYTPLGHEKQMHYKLMMHYAEYTQTIIYNSVTHQIVESSSRSTW